MPAPSAKIFKNRYAVRAVHSILSKQPVACSYFVTNRCNYKCQFCDYPTFNNDKKQELSVEDVEVMAKKLADCGVIMMSIIGGEPLVRKDLVQVAERVARHMMVQVTTNGWFMDRDRAAAIFAAGVLQVNVSVDSPDPEVHNTGRQNQQAFKRAIAAIEMLRDAPKIASDQRVIIESILSARNADQVEAMLDLAESLGVSVVFQPFSGGHIEGQIDDMQSWRDTDISARMLALKDSRSSLYNNRPMIERFSQFFRDGVIPDCKAGETIFNIDSYGNITRCEEQRKRYGNLLQLSVPEIRKSLARIVEDTRQDGCNTCYLRTRGESEPLYDDDFEHFLARAEELFEVKLPAVVPPLARVPGMRTATRHVLSGINRLLSVRDRLGA